ERLVAEVGGGAVGEEVPALDKQDAGGRDLAVLARRDEGAVVADAERRATRGPAVEEAPDEFELAPPVRAPVRSGAPRHARLPPAGLERAQAGRNPVEHAVDVLVAVGAAEGLGELHG